jgi:hypothetical protein
MLLDVSACLERLPRWRFIVLSVIISLGLSVSFFCPKFWLMGQPWPGTFEWDRALTFLHQCQSPFDDTIEPAMRWRLLPPLVAHIAGLTGYGALVIPYMGVIALVAAWTLAAERLLADRLAALLLTVVLGTTAAIISITNVYGINDGWFLLGLLAVATGRGWPSLVFSGLLAPWVDERFLLGWPLALFCRWWLNDRPARFRRDVLVAVVAITPYVLTRAGLTFRSGDQRSERYIQETLSMVSIYLPYVRIGLWMGFRSAWIIILLAIVDWGQRGGWPALRLGVGCAAVGWLAITALACDLSRSTNLLLPLLLCGAVALRRMTKEPLTRYYWLGGCGVANLLMPCMNVTYNKVTMFWGLPLELLRLFKNYHF